MKSIWSSPAPSSPRSNSHKNKGGDRLARKARAASSLLKEIILSEDRHKIIRQSSPMVKVFVKVGLRPDPTLADLLDYNQPDDQLVGIVSTFSRDNPGVDARLLTHDAGPMASGRSVNVVIEPVPDEWLLPPEPSETEKRIRSLEAEVTRLKENEPKITIDCIGPDGRELKNLEFDVPQYEALSPAEISRLVTRLSELAPFESGAERRLNLGALNLAIGFIAPTNEQLEEYREKCDKWLKQSEDALRNLHVAFEEARPPPQFIFRIANSGSRPANDVLVRIRSAGRFEIKASRGDVDRKDGEAREQGPSMVKLPRQPPRPVGRIPGFEAMQRAYDAVRSHRSFAEEQFPLLKLANPRPLDRNRFYLKSETADQFTFECNQWRHGIGPEMIEGSIKLNRIEVGEIGGVIVCSIHGENLVDAVERTIPVEIPRGVHKRFSNRRQTDRSNGLEPIVKSCLRQS